MFSTINYNGEIKFFIVEQDFDDNYMKREKTFSMNAR